jgi:hypothetical protein
MPHQKATMRFTREGAVVAVATTAAGLALVAPAAPAAAAVTATERRDVEVRD